MFGLQVILENISFSFLSSELNTIGYGESRNAEKEKVKTFWESFILNIVNIINFTAWINWCLNMIS